MSLRPQHVTASQSIAVAGSGGKIPMPRTINDAGLALIERSEGCELTAYQDVAGIWTIGYGHIGGVGPGMTITQDQAADFLRQDLASAEEFVSVATGAVATADNQFAAMVSLCFNIGSGNFRTSSVLKFHLAGSVGAAADAFLLWDKAHVDGVLQVVAGLLARRQAERALYLTADVA
jgi:lysozyme